MSDEVHNPAHYGEFTKMFGIEPVEFCRHLTYPAGCAFKYLARHRYKGKPLQDLEKALKYLEWSQEDWDKYPGLSILPHREGLVFNLAANHFNDLTGVYRALKDILYGHYYEASLKISEEIENYL